MFPAWAAVLALCCAAARGAYELPPLYHCEACRTVLEEVEFHLERQLAEQWSKQEKAGGGASDGPQEVNPRDVLDTVCRFDKKQPEAMRQRWRAFAQPYRDYCAGFLADEGKRAALIEALNGDRSMSPSARRKGAVARATALCSHQLALCPAPAPVRSVCDACVAVAHDLDNMLTRIPRSNEEDGLSEELLHDNLSSQCEALPWRFGFGSKREEDLLTETCQDYIGEYDDDIVRAATKFKLPERRAELAKTCAPYCKGTAGEKRDEL